MTADIPRLETDRLMLRPPDITCADHYQEFFTDPEASRDYSGPLTVGQAWARLASDIGYWHLQGFGVWILEKKSDQLVVGGCGFWQGKGWPRELTWWLLPSARGSGLAAEASRAAISYAYEVLEWDAVETYMNDGNQPARRLAEGLGGIKTDRLPFPDGKDRDLYRIPR